MSWSRYAGGRSGQSARGESVIRILLFSLIIIYTIRQIKKVFTEATVSQQDVSADEAIVDVDVIVDEQKDHHSSS